MKIKGFLVITRENLKLKPLDCILQTNRYMRGYMYPFNPMRRMQGFAI